MKKQNTSKRAVRVARRPFSPVITGDVKLYGVEDGPCVDVRFESIAQLDVLIAALMALRESPGDSFDHVHLQDPCKGPLKRAGTEIVFWRPGLERDGGDRSCVRTAIKALGQKIE